MYRRAHPSIMSLCTIQGIIQNTVTARRPPLSHPFIPHSPQALAARDLSLSPLFAPLPFIECHSLDSYRLASFS